MLDRNNNHGGMGHFIPNLLITIEDDDVDDDDEVLIYSPNPTSFSSSSGAMGINVSGAPSSTLLPVVNVTEDDDDDLQVLQLGSRVHALALHDGPRPSGFITEKRRESLQAWTRDKTTMLGLGSSSRKQSRALKLKCTICLDTMKEETSTMCGHVFCRSCISSAIHAQNRCPTCRKVLSMANIHRIYLPGTTSPSTSDQNK